MVVPQTQTVNKESGMYSETVKCKSCGGEFERHDKRHVYCSGRCKEEYRLLRLELHEGVCKGCGKPITYKIDAGKPTKQWCSASCALSHVIPTKVLTCVDCGNTFEFKGRTTKLRCDVCWKKHQSVLVMSSRARKDPSVQIGVGSGGNQNNDVSIDPEQREMMNASRRAYYARKADRLRVIARSKYREKTLRQGKACDICGYDKNEAALVVHHKDMDRVNNDESNLVVICANCHSILHKEIKKRQKTQQLTANAVYELVKAAELKSRKKTGNSLTGQSDLKDHRDVNQGQRLPAGEELPSADTRPRRT